MKSDVQLQELLRVPGVAGVAAGSPCRMALTLTSSSCGVNPARAAIARPRAQAPAAHAARRHAMHGGEMGMMSDADIVAMTTAIGTGAASGGAYQR